MSDTKLLLATTNRGKITELSALLAGIEVEVLGLCDIQQSDLEPPDEHGNTFCENALIKGRYWMEHSGLQVLADDSGLTVDYLDGAPGIFSARYAGKNASDSVNNALLLHNLAEVTEKQRTAAFHCCIALCRPGLPPVTFTGRADGIIAQSPAGDGGFGYDPLFFYPPLGRTFAQLAPDEKNKISHRAAALREFLDWLRANQLEK